MDSLGLLIIVLGTLVFSLFSKRVEQSWLTLPFVFTGFGWVIGNGGLGLVELYINHSTIQTLAEITLILVLFTDASQIKLKLLLHDFQIPLRMLLIGMPLTILLGSLLTYWISPEAPFVMAILVAAILTPTDAALGQSVVSSPKVPIRIRQAINVESGLNDGIALPIVMICAILASGVFGVTADNLPTNLWLFTLLQITLGPLAGAATGYLGARLLDFSIHHRLISPAFQGIAFLATAIFAYLFAEEIGGNGFIAAFVSGLIFGATLKNHTESLFEFMESEGKLLVLITFLIFGAVMLPVGLEHATWEILTLAVLYLTVVRMLPIMISLTGLGLTLPTQLFLGWFGPRGLASILFALLILERFPIPGGEEVLTCVVLTVILSIVAHGLSATPLVDWYGKYVTRLPDKRL